MSNGQNNYGWGYRRVEWRGDFIGHMAAYRTSGGVDSNDWFYTGYRCH
jgi:hypothetical protein